MMWGVGEEFPQLSPREVSVAHHRYTLAQAGGRAPVPAPDETLCDGVRRDVGDQTLRESITALLSVKDQSQSEDGGMLMFAQLSKQALREELSLLDAQGVRARDENMDERVESCRPHVDNDPPNTDNLDKLEEQVKVQKEEQTQKVNDRDMLRFRRDNYAEGHPKYPDQKVWEDAIRDVKTAHRALRATNKLVDKEMQELSGAHEHWPEVLNSAPNLNDFKRMDCLSTEGTIESYEDVKPLKGKGRNDVYTATLDDCKVVLKAYDLTKASTAAIQTELSALHKMRHTNIVAVEAVFGENTKTGSRMYLQMPLYNGDLKDWLVNNPQPASEPRRKILLGIIRGIARVHEFDFTHNDIKLENVLLSKAGEAVLCDFELLREEAAYKDSSGSTTTVVGGTPAYMAPERVAGGQPTQPSDMYSFGVVLLLCFAPHRIKDVTQQAFNIDSVDEAVVRETLCGLIMRKEPPTDGDAKMKELMEMPIDEFTARAEKLHRVPPETVRAQERSEIPDEVNVFLEKLLSQSASKRPAARDMLPKVGSDAKGNYFSKATLDLPSYWQDDEHDVIEVKDEETMTKLKRAIQPEQPDELGTSTDAGKH